MEDSIKDVTTEKGKAAVQWGVDWGKDLLFLEAEGKGARINIPIDIAESGRYEIVARTAQAPDYGDYVALLDGESTNLDKRQAATSEIPFPGPEVFHSYLPEVYVAVDRPLGWFQLEKGRHTLSFVCIGRDERSAGYNFGVEDVILEKLPATAGEFESQVEHQLAPVPPEAAPAQAAGTPLYRGRPLAAYVAKLHQGPGGGARGGGAGHWRFWRRRGRGGQFGCFDADRSRPAGAHGGGVGALPNGGEGGRGSAGLGPSACRFESPGALTGCRGLGGDGAGSGAGAAGVGSRPE